MHCIDLHRQLPIPHTQVADAKRRENNGAKLLFTCVAAQLETLIFTGWLSTAQH